LREERDRDRLIPAVVRDRKRERERNVVNTYSDHQNDRFLCQKISFDR
jgi:hypothetical protein